MDRENSGKYGKNLQDISKCLHDDLTKYVNLYLDSYDKDNEEELHKVGYILRKIKDVLSALYEMGFFSL